MGFAPGPGAVTNCAMMSPLGSWNTPLQLFGKSGASPAHDPSQGLAQEPDLLDDLHAAHGVQLDGRELLLRPRPVLPQHGGGHPELAHIVQHPGVEDRLPRLARMPISRPIMTAPRETRFL